MTILTRANAKILDDLVELADGRFELVREAIEELSSKDPTLSQVIDYIVDRKDEGRGAPLP